MRQDELDFLNSTPLFDTTPMETIRRIVGANEPRDFPKEEVLFHQGAPATSFYLIFEGWLKVYRLTRSGEEAVIGIFGRGESFAEAAMFMGGLYPACAETVTSCRLLRIDRSNVHKVIHDNPDCAFHMLASASRHLKHLVQQIQDIKTMSGPRRVADFLVRLAPTPAGSCVIGLPYEKALIAMRLGMKPESFSRALSRLRPFGVVVDREHVVISEVESLAEYARTGDRKTVKALAKCTLMTDIG